MFIDFKKAFDRVWHKALWATMKKYNISGNIIMLIQELYDNATSAVLYNGKIGDWFRTTVGVRQGCLLSPTLFNIFLERIMADALEDHDGTVSIGGRPITNLRFADDIDAIAGSERELKDLVEKLDTASNSYGMEISAEKTKIMYNGNSAGITGEIKVKDQVLNTVDSFKYLGAIISDDGSKPEILSRIAQATSALARLRPIWENKKIRMKYKIRLLRSLVISIFLYACESWTLNADLERRISAMEMRCYRRLLGISYSEHITNKEIMRVITKEIGEHDSLLSIVKSRKLKWYGHVTRSSGLSKTILQGTVEGKRKTGRPRKRWSCNIQEWTGLSFAESQRTAENRQRWRSVVTTSMVVPQQPRIGTRRSQRIKSQSAVMG